VDSCTLCAQDLGARICSAHFLLPLQKVRLAIVRFLNNFEIGFLSPSCNREEAAMADRVPRTVGIVAM
jgi:hypothetical protein